jgi:sugar O-acyltransferase (sialic acid O-acetyltransferase NeuD family)
MLIAGTGGHAIEVYGVLLQDELPEKICFFNDTDQPDNPGLPAHIPVLRTEAEARQWLEKNNAFALGVGKPAIRKILFDKLSAWGGKPGSVISAFAHIGQSPNEWGEALNIMTGAVITEAVHIDRGSLIHIHSSIHHNARIGEFSEISPGCRILGGVTIGNYVSIGAGAVVLPGIKIEDYAVIGAGAIVTRDVQAGITVIGNPARPV